MRLDHLLSRGMSRGGELRGASYESDLSQASVASRVTANAVKRHIRNLERELRKTSEELDPKCGCKVIRRAGGAAQEAKRESWTREAVNRKSAERPERRGDSRNRIGESKEIVLPLFSG